MAYSTTTIADVRVRRAGSELVVAWASTAPAGTTFQVYLGSALAWAGTARSCVLPWPEYRQSVDVGTVLPAEKTVDFSGSLAPALDRASLAWYGGTFLSPTIAGFRVYGSSSAGGPVNYVTPLATVPAYPGGIVLDGFGLGRFGKGGFGQSESAYAWRSNPLSNGIWTFAAAPFDAAGNELPSPGTIAVTIAAPPQPPAANSRGVRLSYAYDPVLFKVTLTWLASP